jgi:hypothetical protein
MGALQLRERYTYIKNTNLANNTWNSLRDRLEERGFHHDVYLNSLEFIHGKAVVEFWQPSNPSPLWTYEFPCPFIITRSVFEATHDFPDEFYEQLVETVIVHYTKLRLAGVI